MAALRVIDHTPSINETGVYRNQPIHVTFDRAIEPESVTWQTVSVNDNQTYTTVVGNRGVVWTPSGVGGTGVVTEITFTPEINFLADNSYNVYVYGTPNSILGKSGEEIQDTYSWEFTTGTGLLGAVPSGGVPSGAPPSSGTDVELSGIPEGDQALISSFAVYSTDPQHQEPNVDINLSQIQVVFTGEISTSLSDMSGYVSVEETPVLQ